MNLTNKILSVALLSSLVVLVALYAYFSFKAERVVPSQYLLGKYSYIDSLDMVHARLELIKGAVSKDIERIDNEAADLGGRAKVSAITGLVFQSVNDKFSKLDDADKLRYSVDVYAGFVARNIFMNRAYCQKQGVEIDAYITAFWQRNADLKAKASQYYFSEKWERDIFRSIENVAMPWIDYEFRETARVSENSEKELCEMLNSEAAHVLNYMDFEQKMPELYQTIVGAP